MMQIPQIRWAKALCAGLVILSLAAFPGAASAVNITGWDFEDGTMQGWTVISASSMEFGGPTSYGALSRTELMGGLVRAWDPIGYKSKDPNAGFMVGPTPFTDRAFPQDAPLVLRSPTFELFSGGDVRAHVLGGIPQPDSVAPANYSDLSGPSIDTQEASPNDKAYQGLALRRDSDGAYLLHKARSSALSGGTSWQQLKFTAAELQPIIDANPGALFTLDLIDTAHGQFGNVVIDNVTRQIPAGASLMSGGGQWNILKRDSLSVVNDTMTGNGGLASADAVLALPNGDPSITAQFEGTAPVINIHSQPGGSLALTGHFADDSAPLGGSVDRYAMKVTGQINVLQGGDITFGFVGNDGGRLKINGITVAQDDFAGDIACDSIGTINLTAGIHDVEFVMFETTGADTWELYVATELGTFTSINQSTFELLEAYGVPVVPGDFDSDGDVDGLDFVAWQSNFPMASGASLTDGDADGDGDVDGADFVVWQTNFPYSPGPGTSPVPEPHAGLLLAIGGVLALGWRRMRG